MHPPNNFWWQTHTHTHTHTLNSSLPSSHPCWGGVMFAFLNFNARFLFLPAGPWALRGFLLFRLHVKQGPVPPYDTGPLLQPRHKSLTTNSINLFGLEYLWMPVKPLSAVFCLRLNAPQTCLASVQGSYLLQGKGHFHKGLVVWSLGGIHWRGEIK